MNNTKYYVGEFLPGNPIDYTESNMERNSSNYRTKEFDQIDWKNSIVIFGCSNVFGAGLTDGETISHQLSMLTNRPVINMGVPSSSIAYSLYNQVILAEKCSAPYAVINLWTSINRLSYFYEKGPCHLGPWTARQPNKNIFIRSIKSVFDAWNINDINPALQSTFLQKMAEIIWKDTKHFQGTFFPNTSDALNVELFQYKDYANDNHHPGPLTAKAVAEQLAVWCR